MALDEVDLVLLALDDFDEPVRQLLLAVGGHAFGSSLVVDDDGARRLDLEFVRERRSSFQSIYSTLTCFDAY